MTQQVTTLASTTHQIFGEDQFASVRKVVEADGFTRFRFCDGHSDAFAYRTESDAMAEYDRFLSRGATEAQLERLNDAHQHYLRMGDFETCADPRAHIRAGNVMFDRAVDCGMPNDHDDVDGWVAERVTAWLTSGVGGAA